MICIPFLIKSQVCNREKDMEKWMSSWLHPATVGIIFFAAMLVTMVPEVVSKRYIVGGNQGWTSNVNYTIWSQKIHFHQDDWLFFVYDRNQMSVLQVNKTNYETCNSGYPIHNWTTGAGRDVVPLNVTRDYYFISGNGFCYAGMKLAIQVEVPSPLPSPSPIEDQSPSFPPSLSPMNDHPSRFPPSVSPESGVSSKVTPSTAPVDNYSPRRRITNQNIVIPAMFAIALACIGSIS